LGRLFLALGWLLPGRFGTGSDAIIANIWAIHSSCFFRFEAHAWMAAAKWRTVSCAPLKLIRASGRECTCAARCMKQRIRLYATEKREGIGVIDAQCWREHRGAAWNRARRVGASDWDACGPTQVLDPCGPRWVGASYFELVEPAGEFRWLTS
jgi:hypothetical protein